MHNHPKNSFTPPSGKNFGIFLRKWKKFELIARNDGLWILEGKYLDEKLTKELQEESVKLFVSSLNYCLKKYSNKKEIDERCDYLYGARLSKYIKFKIIELPDESLENKELILEKEAENILKNIRIVKKK